MDWTFVFMMGVLKIPVIAAIWLVWWAVRQEPDPHEEPASGDGGTRRPPHPRPGRPRGPRRGPHSEPGPPAPPRTRTPVHRARTLDR